ncbi:MAG TPA: hypothetical protein VHL58_19750 [Thermoanaerobaculia bacterium]|nr:hypothetical protein [Thermoanaerobaculia bacterium]
MAERRKGPLEGRGTRISVSLPDEQILWLKTRKEGLSGTLRTLVFEAMNLDNLKKSVAKK